jgi:hypothetical protein
LTDGDMRRCQAMSGVTRSKRRKRKKPDQVKACKEPKLKVFRPRVLSEKERSDALNGIGSLGAAANIYLSLVAAAVVHTEKTGSTESQKVASVYVQHKHIPVVAPEVALQVFRLLSLGIRGLEPNLPKPSPFVVTFVLYLVNKSLFGRIVTVPGSPISPTEFVATWGLQEWLQQNPDIKVSEEELGELLESERQRKRAKKKRGKRDPSLWKRGIRCVLREDPNITAERLEEWLEGRPRTYDDDDIELRLQGSDVVVEDLVTGATAHIRAVSLRKYLQRARCDS